MKEGITRWFHKLKQLILFQNTQYITTRASLGAQRLMNLMMSLVSEMYRNILYLVLSLKVVSEIFHFYCPFL